jgi:quercetin dioxygenase-like cupin family protein
MFNHPNLVALRTNPLTALAGGFWLASLLTASAVAVHANPRQTHLPTASVVELMTRDLISGPQKEVVMLTVSYPASGASLPHRHDAQVFVYVLEGVLNMQVRGSPPVKLHAGETFYESPDDVHIVSANDSHDAPAKILVMMIKDKGKPGSRTVTD